MIKIHVIKATFQTVWYATKTQKGGVVNYVIDGKDESFNWDYTIVGDTAMYYPGYYMPAEEIRAKTQNREGNHYLILPLTLTMVAPFSQLS